MSQKDNFKEGCPPPMLAVKIIGAILTQNPIFGRHFSQKKPPKNFPTSMNRIRPG
jgi:hypothetical protein